MIEVSHINKMRLMRPEKTHWRQHVLIFFQGGGNYQLRSIYEIESGIIAF